MVSHKNTVGWLNLDKPSGITSTHALNKVKRLLRLEKAGHAGTLDPMATGILPIAIGAATRLVNHAQDSRKTYEFTIKWGVETDTLDAEGKVTATSDVIPGLEVITAALPSFIGKIQQLPPAYSALKVDGKRAYDLARAGEAVELKPRDVECFALNLLEHKADDGCSMFRLECGKGFYVRALARDLAQHLGTYGSIWSLRRTKVGVFNESGAISLEKLEELDYTAFLKEILIPPQAVLDDIPALKVGEAGGYRILSGQPLDVSRAPGIKPYVEQVAAYAGDILLAVGEIKGYQFNPRHVFIKLKTLKERYDVGNNS